MRDKQNHSPETRESKFLQIQKLYNECLVPEYTSVGDDSASIPAVKARMMVHTLVNTELHVLFGGSPVVLSGELGHFLPAPPHQLELQPRGAL